MPPTQSENRYGSLFFFGVLAFALGIYVQANYRLPTVYTSVLCIALLITAPFLFVHARRTACICLLFCFVLAGIVRLGTIPDDSAILYNSYQSTQPNAPLVYEGVIIESSPNAKIVKLISPEQFRGIRATLSSSENMTINDRIKIYGQLKELTLTYKNPSLISSRWLRRIEGVSYRLNGDIVSIVRNSSIVESWRRYLSDKIQNAGAKHADILKALTIGDTAGISIDTKQVFSETGTSHILAISGSNIAIVTSFFFLLLRLLMRVSDVLKLRGDDKRYAALLSIPFVLFFVLTAGAGIPIIRAAIMITIYMFAIFFGRNRHLSNSLAVSALIILLIYPHSLFTPAFQLSFVCVFSIDLFTRTLLPYSRGWQALSRWSFTSIVVSISAMIGTLPIVLYHFYGFNPLSFLYNIFAVPLMCAVATPLAFIGMLSPFGEYLLRLSGETISFTLLLLRKLNTGYLYPLVRPNLIEIAGYFVILTMFFYLRTKITRFIFLGLVLPSALVYSSIAVHDRFFNNTMCVNIMDVGLGDAIFIEAPQGMRILVDGGGVYSGDFDIGKFVVAPVILSKKTRTIDYVIITHPHKDHIGGLLYILNNFNVRHLVTAMHLKPDRELNHLFTAARKNRIPVEFWAEGDILNINEATKLTVLHPPAANDMDDLNKGSLVFRMDYGSKSFLMTGDIDADVEEKIIFSNFRIHADVMKVPHHGSVHSSSPSFIRAVDPVMAVLSVGPGIRGIPADEALHRYSASSVPLFRTDRDGMITFCSDGTRISYCTFN